MPTITVQPRPTPEERADAPVEIEVADALRDLADLLEEWIEYRQGWALSLQEGHDFGRTNNVEARLLFAQGEQVSTLVFRLEQVDAAEDTGDELVLRFEEEDGIAKLVRLRSNGLDVELFHILTFT